MVNAQSWRHAGSPEEAWPVVLTIQNSVFELVFPVRTAWRGCQFSLHTFDVRVFSLECSQISQHLWELSPRISVTVSNFVQLDIQNGLHTNRLDWYSCLVYMVSCVSRTRNLAALLAKPALLRIGVLYHALRKLREWANKSSASQTPNPWVSSPSINVSAQQTPTYSYWIR
jgi:hypothetical protein